MIKKICVTGMMICALIEASWAGARDQAFVLHKRLTGISPSAAVLDQMAKLISQGNYADAAKIATANSFFFDITLKNWAAAFSNEAQSPVVPLNDSTATIIGIVRDGRPFTEALGADTLYIGDVSLGGIRTYTKAPQAASRHYTDVENAPRPIASSLVRVPQSALTGIADTAGILTTQAYGAAFFSAGTNRRVFSGTVKNFWCQDMEQIHDTTIPDFRIRRDVSRTPGGSAKLFQNKCMGCHAVMDSAIGATAFFDYDDGNGLEYTANRVVAKVNRNATVYPEGFNTTDDSWLFLGDHSTSKSFSRFGWRGAKAGNGLRSLATALSQSRGFSECIVTRVFSKVCLGKPEAKDQAIIQSLASRFESGGKYDLKELFEQTAITCLEM